VDEPRFKVGDRVVFRIDCEKSRQLPNFGDRGVVEFADMLLDFRWHINWDKGLKCDALETEICFESEWDDLSKPLPALS
jgi:hypothetical protein